MTSADNPVSPPVPRSPEPAPESMTETMRRRITRAMEVCPLCHQPRKGLRPMAREIGIPFTTLGRWLNGGNMSGRNLDLIAAWLADRPSL